MSSSSLTPAISAHAATVKKELKLISLLQQTIDKHRITASLDTPYAQTVKQYQQLFDALQPTLNKLIELQATITARSTTSSSGSTADDNESKLASLSSWLKERAPDCGIDRCFVIRPSQYGNALFATMPLKKGQTFIAIPRHCMIRTDDTTFDEIIDSEFVRGRANVKLAIILHCYAINTNTTSTSSPHTTTNNTYAPYINALPSLDQLIMPTASTSTTILHQLSSSPISIRALSLIINTLKIYILFYLHFHHKHHLFTTTKTNLKLFNLSQNGFTFTYNQYRWAICTVMSRQNQIPSSSENQQEDNIMALIPGWDMCNHNTKNIRLLTTYYSTEENALLSLAATHYKINDPIDILYGHRPNSQLFLYMGFLDDHHNDTTTATIHHNNNNDNNIHPTNENQSHRHIYVDDDMYIRLDMSQCEWKEGQKLRQMLLTQTHADTAAAMIHFLSLPLPRPEHEFEAMRLAEIHAYEEELREQDDVQQTFVAPSVPAIRTSSISDDHVDVTRSDTSNADESDTDVASVMSDSYLRQISDRERQENRQRFARMMHFIRVATLNKDEMNIVFKRISTATAALSSAPLVTENDRFNARVCAFVNSDHECRALTFLIQQIENHGRSLSVDESRPLLPATTSFDECSQEQQAEMRRATLMKAYRLYEQHSVRTALSIARRWLYEQTNKPTS